MSLKLFKPYGWVIGGAVYEKSVKDWVERHVLSLFKAFNVFIIDGGSSSLNKYSYLKGLTLKDLELGVFVKTNDKFYYLRYYPKWDWIIGSYITSDDLLHQVYYLKEQFLTKASRTVKLLTFGILLVIVISAVGVYRYYKELLSRIKDLLVKELAVSRMARRLKLLAYKDDVTRLPNRHKFFKDLPTFKESEKKLHFAIVNIRNFRDINELFGFEGGNEVLKKFAIQLKNTVRKRSKLKNCKAKVYRIRGDKFGVLGCSMTDASFIELVQDVIKELEKVEFNVEFNEQKVNFRLDLVAGISKNPEELLIEAEIAEELAKKNGLDVYMVDSEVEKIKRTLHKNIQMATLLKQAVESGAVVPYFQPIVNLKTGEVDKYEVLMRIEFEGKVLTPGQFLPVAKKIAIYRKLSKQLIEKALKVAEEKGVNLSINLSSEDLASKSMTDWLINTIQEKGIADKITFEIVETEAFSNIETLEKFYRKVKEIGAYLAIDDFGSGYSNYEYLAIVRPDYIKIDGSLIRRIPESKEVEKLVGYLVAFSKDLGIKTVAEFVSSEEILEKVKELGIDFGQGFYLGKPKSKI